MIQLKISHKGNEPIMDLIQNTYMCQKTIDINIDGHIYNILPVDGVISCEENGDIVSEFIFKTLSRGIPR